MKILSLLFLCLIALSCQKSINKKILDTSIEKLEKFNDLNKVEFFTLKNGIKVFLTSTKDIRKSMVSLSVAAGSGLDPKGQEGIAHFLEHMLFLGTKKYPKVGEYQSFFNSHQGSFNAYTSTENTNYHFEIPHEHLDDAIDRFAQFFISPTFEKKYVKREKFAVNSEHQKNLLNDGRRLYRMKQFMLPKDHPVRNFSTGNSQTLKNVSQADVVKFYKSHYSANLMNLVIYSPLSIKEMKKLVEKHFSSVENRNLKTPRFPLVRAIKKPQIVEVKSKSKMQKLVMDFNVPLQREKYWKTKPLHIIGHLIGHEGKGSLLSLLKEKNLAFGLGAGSHESSFQNTFGISISLTEKGLKNIDKIIGLVFNFINVARNEGLKDYIFNEIDTMQRLEYVYAEKQVSLSEVSSLADYLFKYPYKDIKKRASLFYKKPGNEYKQYLELLTPANLTVYIQHPDARTNKKEKYYSVNYSINEVSDAKQSSWLKAKNKKLKLPDENQYIPQDLELRLDEDSKYPQLVLNGEKGTFYFKQNKDLQYPNAMITLRLLTHKKFLTPRYKVLNSLYLSALSDTLNEWRYMAELAGLKFDVSSFSRGIEVSMDGYSDKLPLLLRDLLGRLKNIEMSDEKFNNYVREINKGFDNFKIQPAYHQAGYWLKYIVKKDAFSHKELKSELNKLKPKDIFGFKEQIYNEIRIEGLCFGNLNSKDLKPILDDVHTILGAKNLDISNTIIDEDIKYSKALNAFSFPTKGNNSTWYGHFQFGPRQLTSNSYLRLLSAIIDSEFYSEMRTNQQLGYIVHSGYNYMSKSYGYDFLIQSSRFSAKQLRKRALTWITENIPSLLKSVTDEKFEQLKKTIHAQILIPERSMREKMVWLITQAYVLKGDFEYKNKFAQEVLSVDREKFYQEVTGKLLEQPVELSISVGNKLKGSTKIQQLKEKLSTYK